MNTVLQHLLTSEYRSRIDVDTSQEQLRIDFNISFPHLHCDRASVDRQRIKYGRNQADITRTVEKWQLDEKGHQTVDLQGPRSRHLNRYAKSTLTTPSTNCTRTASTSTTSKVEETPGTPTSRKSTPSCSFGRRGALL